jgi:hypothetical protein
VVTAELAGQFVDTYYQGSGPVAASLEGTWQISLSDPTGNVVAERSIDGNPADSAFATSLYWPGAKPETLYEATASFTPSNANRTEFSVTQGSPVTYSTPPAQRSLADENPTAEPTATGTSTPVPATPPIPASQLADAELASSYTVAMPPWAFVLTIVMLAGLGVLVAMLGLRLRRTGARDLSASPAISDAEE